MQRALLLDTETSGLNPETDAVLEVGAILYDLRAATALESYSSLLRTAGGNAAEAVNRIPAAVLVEAPEPAVVWQRVREMAERADVIIAHNADFDRAFVPASIRDAVPWVCSMSALQWPRRTRPEPSLVQLVLEHDLAVAVAHRALADCDLLARLLTRSRELGADLVELVGRGLRPKAEFVALVSYDEREKAKAAGFRWSPETKQWRRRMAIEDVSALPFRVRQVA